MSLLGVHLVSGAAFPFSFFGWGGGVAAFLLPHVGGGAVTQFVWYAR